MYQIKKKEKKEKKVPPKHRKLEKKTGTWGFSVDFWLRRGVFSCRNGHFEVIKETRLLSWG